MLYTVRGKLYEVSHFFGRHPPSPLSPAMAGRPALLEEVNDLSVEEHGLLGCRPSRTERATRRSGGTWSINTTLSPAGLPFIGRMYQKLMALRRVYGLAGGGWLLVPANMTAAAGGLPHATHWAIWLPRRFPGVVVCRDLWSKQ